MNEISSNSESGAGASETSRRQHLAQRLAADFGGVRCAEQGDDLIDMAEIVAGENAEGIADDIVEAAAAEIEIDVPGFLFRSRLVEQAARHECRRDRIVARTAGLRGDRRRRCGRRERRARRGRRRLLQFLVQRLQHPGGFLAAGDAEIETRFRLAGDRLGIVVAVVAALAAILLRHRRHHAPPQRAAFGELHAIGNRHGLVVPRRFAVVAIAGGPCSTAAPCSADKRRRTVGRQQPGKEAVQPGALRFGKRRARRNDFEFRRRRHLVHVEASASASLRRVSPSWRRAKVRNVSSGGGAVGEIGLQQSLHGLRRVLGLDVAIDLLPDIGIRTEAAAGEQMIALDRVVLRRRPAPWRRSARCR